MLSHYLDQGAPISYALAAAAIDFVFVFTLALAMVARRYLKE